jgi:hypothetical protein
MKTTFLACALVPVALGGCDPAPTEKATVAAPAAAVAPAEPNAFADRIAALSAKQRDAVLFKAVTDAGGECPALTGSAPHAPVEGLHAWTVHCAAGKGERALDWVVLMNPDGVIRIVRPGRIQQSQ